MKIKNKKKTLNNLLEINKIKNQSFLYVKVDLEIPKLSNLKIWNLKKKAKVKIKFKMR